MILAVTMNILLMGMAGVWLFVHLTMNRGFRVLRERVPDAYQSNIAASPEEGRAPQLMALAVDLLRKEHGSPPYETLSTHEKQIVLHAHAIESLPRWMTAYATLWLWPADRKILRQLYDVKTSRPEQPKIYFGAVHQQLRTLRKG